MSGTTKSHKGSRDREMIRFGEEEAHLKTVVARRQRISDRYASEEEPRQGIAIDKIPIKKPVSFSEF